MSDYRNIHLGLGKLERLPIREIINERTILTEGSLIIADIEIRSPVDIPMLFRYLADKLEAHWSGKLTKQRKALYP